MNRLEWPEIKLTIEQVPQGVLVVDRKVGPVSGNDDCYILRGWDLRNPRHREQLTLLVEGCISKGFQWALQQGHPEAGKRGVDGSGQPYLSFGRAYGPQPAWDIGADTPTGSSYVIARRHKACLTSRGILFTPQAGSGRNLMVDRALLHDVLDALQSYAGADDRDLSGDRAQRAIEEDASLQPTEKEDLIRARRGQGVFRRRVIGVEPYCRLTGISDPRFLRASHIKPWFASDNRERLDAHNGLMLSPHVDHLFDGGYISFAKNGAVLVAPDIDSVLECWSLPLEMIGPPFSEAQERYLAYHRSHCFRGASER